MLFGPRTNIPLLTRTLRLKRPRGVFRVMSTMQNWAFDPRKKRWLFEKPISKPLLDDTTYRLIMLENNLQVLLISDRSADQVGMALDVGVGHVSDPKDMPGLAHFCEHLLFMGTTPFPEENAYKQFVKRHGGFTNASTAASTTTYQFSIQAPYLSGAMERFAAFFSFSFVLFKLCRTRSSCC